ncbi:MAG: sigma-54-dependent Fis family transcriptional regulator [Phycisphaeraceae bacterium]|nr:MAG: sigma-54-dependent Fis family transcriptional regulator [Phycisphaeraceae bacterium]
MSDQARKDRARVLVIDDDPIIAESLSEFLRREGYEPTTALSGREALERIAQATDPEGERLPFDIVICDLSLPGGTGPGGMGSGGIGSGGSGHELARTILREHLGISVIMLTGYGTIESAVESLRLGAIDFLTKPALEQELRLSLERALRHRAIMAENKTLKRRLHGRTALASILGTDHRMQKIFDLVGAVAPTKTTVLMSGESGTGKSMVAHAIHRLSPRKDKPFVELSCGSIPETLLESELFGHVKGAFTGAHADKPGRFLAANGGTIFLDEINSASPGMQLKLLRVLQERKFEPVGSEKTIEVDTRVILATNQPLEALVADGRFRQDLYYRINVVKIELPPLRERPGDIQMLAEHFLARFGSELGKQLTGFTPAAVEALLRYSYPGNVRELQNIVERASVLTRSQTVGIEDLPSHVVEQEAAHNVASTLATGSSDHPVAWVPMKLEDALREPEREILKRALHANGWNRQKTSEQLGINRTTLYKKMKMHGIDGAHGLQCDERAA